MPFVLDHTENDVRSSLRNARRVVVKLGTPVVTHVDKTVALGRIGAIVEQIAHLVQEGREVMIVTSGAISTGSSRMHRTIALKQSVRDSMRQSDASRQGDARASNAGSAAVGQALMMNLYELLFSKYNVSCAQVLITEEDLADAQTLMQVSESTVELLQLGTVAIVNENDAVSARSMPVFDRESGEIQWDNDVLTSRLASAVRADVLVVLTDIDSLYAEPSEPPVAQGMASASSTSPSGSSMPMRLSVFRSDSAVVRLGIPSTGRTMGVLSDEGRGVFTGRTRMGAKGMEAMILASRTAVAAGVPAAVITTGHHPLSLQRVLRGEDVGTLFVAEPPRSKM